MKENLVAGPKPVFKFGAVSVNAEALRVFWVGQEVGYVLFRCEVFGKVCNVCGDVTGEPWGESHFADRFHLGSVRDVVM